MASSVADDPTLSVRIAPNPVAQHATLHLTLPATGPVRVSILDMQGREVTRLTNEVRSAGSHQLDWSPALAPGLYAIVVDSASERVVHRVTLVR